jgi:putative addiction module component (TIGR02574 family)
MLRQAIPRFDELSASEKLLLMEELWDDLAGDPAQIPSQNWQREELERRYEEYLQSPAEGSPWAEVRERLLKAFK